MSTEIARSGPKPQYLDSVRDLPAIVELLVPIAGGKSPNEVGLLLVFGQSLGMDMFSSLSQIHLIQGRPTIAAGQQLVLAHRAGVISTWLHTTMSAAKLRLQVPGRDPFEIEYTIEQARTAGLTGRDTWKHHPAEMLRARCITSAIRAYCPEVLGGVVYDRDELESVSAAAAPRAQPSASDVIEGEIVDAKPASKKARESLPDGTVQELLLVTEQALDRAGIELPVGPQDTIANVPLAAETLAAKAMAAEKVDSLDRLSGKALGALVRKVGGISAEDLRTRLGM